MKKTLLALLLIMTGVTVIARPVDQSTAVLVARNFAVSQLDAARRAALGDKPFLDAHVVYTHTMPTSGNAAIYAVDLGTGFVLVSADDVAHPVLGYNLGRTWPKQTLAAQVSSYLDDLARQIESAAGNEPDSETAEEWQELLAPSSTPRPKDIPDSVGPLLTTTWDQGQYYNALCPEDPNGPDGHVYAGCVATAMAQIINYWGYPVHGRGIHSYESNYGTLRVNYDSASYDYTHMPSALTSSSTEEEIQAVATLMRDCGVAANMGYGTFESGTTELEARAGMVNFFLFYSNPSYIRKTYVSTDEWDSLIHTNISAGKPICYTGDDLNEITGHAFVCDGYNYDNYLHFNFGWSGNADGWYLSTAVTTSHYNFSSQQTAILEIYPDSEGRSLIVQKKGHSSFTIDEPLFYKDNYANNSLVASQWSGSVTFVAENTSDQLVIDIQRYEATAYVNIYDGQNADLTNEEIILRQLSIDHRWNDYSPVVSSENIITLEYIGGSQDGGTILCISKNGTCRTVSGIKSLIDSTSVQLSWDENGTSSSYYVECGTMGFNSGEGWTWHTDTSYITIENNLDDTIYEFRIQPLCDSSHNYQINTIIIDNRKLYWTENVNVRPDGYSENEDGSIVISSAEGLAWLSKNVTKIWDIVGIDDSIFDGIRYYNVNDYTRRKVLLESDIDLGRYLWKPIHNWDGIFDGNGHSISNMHVISEGYSGLFNAYSGDTLRDIGFLNAIVEGRGACGTLVGSATSSINVNIINCYSLNYTIKGPDESHIGGLIGQTNATIKNCFTKGNLWSIYIMGGIVGHATEAYFYNCYSCVDTFKTYNETQYPAWKGLLSAYTEGSSFINCFADIDNIAEKIDDSSSFHSNDINVFFLGGAYTDLRTIKNVAGYRRFLNNMTAYTVPDTAINYNYDSIIDLVSALNMGVIESNSPTLRTWIWDSLLGLPVFGDHYQPVCPNVSNISVSNVTYNNGSAMVVKWHENGNAESWQIKCLPHDVFADDSALYYTSHDTIGYITGLTYGKSYDIYVRPLCENNEIEIWGTPVSYVFDKPYWVDVVTTCPQGFEADAEDHIKISSPEGLAWLSVCSNGLNGQPKNNFWGVTIDILDDLDMGQYKWTPIGLHKDEDSDEENVFMGKIYGHGHTINNISCLEDFSSNYYLGMIGFAYYAILKDITLSNTCLRGYYNLGSLVGKSINTEISNCHSINCEIRGVFSLGGLCGSIGLRYDLEEDESEYGYIDCTPHILNCSSSGIVFGDRGVGGLIGGSGMVEVLNCYSYVDVHPSRILSEQGSKGGLIGGASGDVINCYSHGFVEYTENRSGVPVSGVLLGGAASSCYWGTSYGKELDGVPIIGNQSGFIDYLLHFNTFDDSGFFSSAFQIGETTCLDIISALSAGVDTYDTAGIYRHWAPDTTNVNGGFPVFAALPGMPTTGSDSITVCDSYTWHGVEYTENALLVDTLSNMNGCDSIVTHHLVVNHSATGVFTVRACDEYTWHRYTYYESTNEPTYTMPGSNECDSTVTLHLTINHSNASDTTAVACDGFGWGGQWLVTSGQYEETLTNAAGCDSTVTMHLTVNHSTDTTITETIVQNQLPYTFNGETFNGSESRDIILTNSAGCDSVIHYTLNVEWNSENTVDSSVCASQLPLVWNGVTFNNAGTQPVTLTGSNGADSVVVLMLNIFPQSYGDTSATACERFDWYGETYNASGNYPHTLVAADRNGCDSIVTLSLTINHSTTGVFTVMACDEYSWHRYTYYESTNEPTYTMTGSNGCDSTVTLHLTINYSSVGDTTAVACDSFTWWNTDYTNSTNEATHVLANAAGCDSTVTLHLTINHSITAWDEFEACDSYTWNGQTFTESVQNVTYTTLTSAGCDSTVILHLTINNSAVGEESVTSNEPYTWHGTTYDVSGTYTWIGTTVDGCDSTVTLHLTIEQGGNEGIDDVTMDDGVKVYAKGNVIVVSGEGQMTGVHSEKVMVYDIMGRVLRQVDVDGGRFSIEIPVPSVGVYMVKVGEKKPLKVVVRQ